MGTNSSRVTSNYELKISEAPAVKLAAPVVKPQNGRRHSAGAAIHPSSPEKPVPGPTAPTASRTDGFYSPVKQASTTKLGVPPRTSSMNDLLRRQSSIKQETYSTKFVAQTVCSPTVPWIVKKAKFIHLPPSAIEFGRVIGRGLMGVVRLCRLTGEDKYFVVKQLRKESIIKHHDERHVRNEKDILNTLTSPFCIRLFGTFQDRGHLYLALEYVPGGELFRRLGRKKSFPPLEAKFYLTEVFCALEHLQALGFVYRDLKPENIAIDEEGHCKLIDFGFSTPCANNERMHTVCGTPAYLSPEQLDGKLTNGYTRIVDWWSFGVLLYELLTGKTPFCKSNNESAYEIFLRILKNKIHFPMFFDVEAKNLISKLCHPTLEKRLCSAPEIKLQPYFSVPWSAVLERRLIPPYVPVLKDVGDSHCFHRYEDLPVKIEDGDPMSDGRNYVKKLLGPINAKIHGLFQYLQSTVDPTLSFQILKVWSASVVGTRMPQMNGVTVVVLLFLTGSVMCITGFARAFYQRPVTYRRFSLSSAPLPASLNGVIAIYKPPSYTSADVVNIVKGVLKLGCSKSGSKSSLPKVGHGGTLDPMAEGVLVIGIGAGTKMLQSFLNGSKTYIAVAALGTETNTLDRMGEIVKRLPFDHVDQTLIENTLPAYTGNITQIPPMFSALKSNGKRLYDLARKGIVVERKPREVSVYHLQLLSPNDMVGIFSEFPSTANPPCSLPHDFALRIVCSGGFYVRSLIDDIGKHMQTCAHMTYLQRSQQGPFTVKDCLKLSDLTYRNVVDNLNHCSTVATGGYSPMESKNLLLESIEIR